MFAGYNNALEDLKTWNKHFISLLFMDLLKADKIDFVGLSNLYVQDLERRNNELNAEIMPLAMHLSLALKGHGQKELAEKLLYESGYFRGSTYGDELEKKFKK
jgi:hypothetical protein